MIGDDLLVAPIVKPDVTRRLVYLPAGTWYDYWTNKRYTGGTMITLDARSTWCRCLYVEARSFRQGHRSTTSAKSRPIRSRSIFIPTIRAQPRRLYEDDGLSPAYKRGEFRRTAITVRRGGRRFVVSIWAAEEVIILAHGSSSSS